MNGCWPGTPTCRDKLVLVSEQGFTDQAKQLAEAKGAVALAPEDLAADDPAYEVVNRLRSMWPKTVSFVPKRTRVFVRRPGEDNVVWFKAPADLLVLLDDGKEFGMLHEVARAVIDANFPRIAEQIGLASIAEDLTAPFTFPAGPPWTIRIDGEERRLSVRWEEPDEPELHLVEAIEIFGQATIRVGEISLTHSRLGDVQYAYGQGKIGDRAALLLITENEQGGKLTIRFGPEQPTAQVSAPMAGP